ncbi:hypothetical protein [Methylobacterium nigriterrae]|uniref:hypothetical protein n=1 Tax=Methylobacterium nigriterrae TaxID=3127512 RepID=UPI003013D889
MRSTTRSVGIGLAAGLVLTAGGLAALTLATLQQPGPPPAPVPEARVEAPEAPVAKPSPPPVPVPPPALDAALAASACGAKAARYEGAKGFVVFVTRKGRSELENPLRPLTPEVTQVLQVTIAGKAATAYGPDLKALRRGGAPGALEAQLGAPIRWDAALPALPDPIAIVSEAGEVLTRLDFRDCAEAPPVKAPPPEAKAKDGKGKDAKAQKDNKTKAKEAKDAREKPAGATEPEGGTTAEAAKPASKPARRAAAPKSDAQKAPPGFNLPQGAIAE